MEQAEQYQRCKCVGSLEYKGSETSARIYDPRYLCPTITTICGGGQEPKVMINSNEHTRIRKLTPLECWRLMGFDDEDFRKAEAVNSNSQLYKQAGNSIVVDVLEAILKELLIPDER